MKPRRALARAPKLAKYLRVDWVLFPFAKAEGSCCRVRQPMVKRTSGKSVQWKMVPVAQGRPWRRLLAWARHPS